MRHVTYFSGRLSGGGKRHCPSAATLAPRRLPSDASATVERGARNEGVGATRMATRMAIRPGITILNGLRPKSHIANLTSTMLYGLRPSSSISVLCYNALWPTANPAVFHIHICIAVWPKTRTSQFAHRNSQIAIRNSQFATRNFDPATLEQDQSRTRSVGTHIAIRNSQIAIRNSVRPPAQSRQSHIAHRTSQFATSISLLPPQIPAGVRRRTRHRAPRRPLQACCNCHGTRPSE